MGDDPEFPFHASKEKEVIEKYYFPQESEFMAAADFFERPDTPEMRSDAIRTIAEYSEGRNFDVYIPYLAMNYFDRFVSRNPLPAYLSHFPRFRKRKLFLTAICCLIIAAKMRDITFRVRYFVNDVNLSITLKALAKMERSILNGLRWRMCSITPFSFVDYYYPRYKELGGFKRRSIIEIIIQAQEVSHLTRYKHSDIASSSLLAAAAIAYPGEFLAHFTNEVDNAPGLCELIHLCGSKNIAIESAESRPVTTQSIQEAIPRRPGKEEVSTSQNDSPAAADDQAIPRRYGKEVASTAQIDPSAATDNQAIPRRPGKEVASTSQIDSPAAADDQAIPRRYGKEVASTAQIVSAAADDQAIPRRPGKEVASIAQIDPSAAADDQAIPRRPGKEVASIAQIDPSAAADDQAIPRRPGKEVASTSQIWPPATAAQHEERRRLVAALDAALEAGLKAAEEETRASQQNLIEASRRFVHEIEESKRFIQTQPATSETEASRRFIHTLQSLFEASRRSIHSLSEIEASQSFILTQPATLEMEAPLAASAASTEDTRKALTICGYHCNSLNDRFNTCCNIL